MEIDFQNYLVTLHSIEVIVQDTKRIDDLSSAITEKIIKWTIISICGRHFVIQDGHHEENIFLGGDIFLKK